MPNFDNYQALTRFGRWVRRHPIMGRVAMLALFPVYVLIGGGVGWSKGTDEGFRDWLYDWKAINSYMEDSDEQ